MKEQTDGGTAFLIVVDGLVEKGLTLRDYFAGVTLQGKAHWRSLMSVEEQEKAAIECYSMADAMLAERENNRERQNR